MEIFHNSTAKYKLFAHTETDKFVVFSPEIFVKIDEYGVISSNPMKGTIDAAVENAEIRLMNDAKEQAEHATIVFMDKNGHWFTPSTPLLAGTKRAQLLAIGKIKAVDLRPNDLSEFVEARLINATTDLENSPKILTVNILK